MKAGGHGRCTGAFTAGAVEVISAGVCGVEVLNKIIPKQILDFRVDVDVFREEIVP